MVNFLPVLAVAIVNMILGSLWYGPIFGKQWEKLMGFTAEHMKAAKEKGMTSSYVLMLIGSLLMSWVLALFIASAEAHYSMWTAAYGIHIALWLWLGFVVPLTLSGVLWEGRPWKLWFLNAGYYFVGLIIMGSILGVWH